MIKNIIFDLGGVVLNIDYQLTPEAFKKIGLNNFEKLYSQSTQTNLFNDFEKGLLSENKFREGIRILTGMIFCDIEFDKAWNAMLLDLPYERIELLKLANKNYRTFLLSNTNIIHYKDYTQSLKKQHNIDTLGELFEKEYYSHEIHLRKPDLECFEYVLNDSNLISSETLFIDDSHQHIEGAKKAGIHTFFMDRNKNLELTDILSPDGKLKINF
jgi:glucose-1-phosphatase